MDDSVIAAIHKITIVNPPPPELLHNNKGEVCIEFKYN